MADDFDTLWEKAKGGAAVAEPPAAPRAAPAAAPPDFDAAWSKAKAGAAPVDDDDVRDIVTRTGVWEPPTFSPYQPMNERFEGVDEKGRPSGVWYESAEDFGRKKAHEAFAKHFPWVKTKEDARRARDTLDRSEYAERIKKKYPHGIHPGDDFIRGDPGPERQAAIKAYIEKARKEEGAAAEKTLPLAILDRLATVGGTLPTIASKEQGEQFEKTRANHRLLDELATLAGSLPAIGVVGKGAGAVAEALGASKAAAADIGGSLSMGTVSAAQAPEGEKFGAFLSGAAFGYGGEKITKSINEWAGALSSVQKNAFNQRLVAMGGPAVAFPLAGQAISAAEGKGLDADQALHDFFLGAGMGAVGGTGGVRREVKRNMLGDERVRRSEARDASRELDAYLAEGRGVPQGPAPEVGPFDRAWEAAKAEMPQAEQPVAVQPPGTSESVGGQSVTAEPSTLQRPGPGPVPDVPVDPTSIKNRIVDREREARGLGPMEKPIRQAFPEVFDKALDVVANDPLHPYDLVKKLIREPRPHTPVEAAELAVHRVNLKKRRAAADLEGIEAQKRGDADGVLEAKRKAFEVGTQLLDLDLAGKQAGTETARALGLRRAELAADYSLVEMENQKRAENDYKPLTEQQHAEVKRLHDELAKTRAELDATLARQADVATKREIGELMRPRTRTDATSPRYGSKNRLVTRESFQKALAEFRGSTLSANPFLDPAKMAAFGKIALFHIEAGATRFADFSRAVLKDVPGAGPYLRAAWTQAQREYSATTAAEAKAAALQGLKDGKGLAGVETPIGKLAEALYRQGVTDREKLIDAVHETIGGEKGGISRREVMDAISGYGRHKKLNDDPVMVELRELKGQMQQIAKLEDMAKGKAPLRTGLEHQAPGDIQRELIREVNEAKKKGGFDVKDPEHELRTALDAVKTRLKNEIADMDRQIAAGKQDIPNKTKLELDAEAKTLKEQRDAKKAQYDEVFEKPGLTDEQRVAAAIKAVERSLVEYQRRVETGDVFPGAKKEGPTSPALEALKKQRDELRQKVDDIRRSVLPKTDQTEAQLRRMEKGVEALEKRIAAGDVFSQKKAEKSRDPRIEAARKKQEDLRERLDDLRQAATPRKSPYEVAVDVMMKRRQTRIDDLERKIAQKDYAPGGPRKEAKGAGDPRVVNLTAREETLKREWLEGLFKDRLANRTKAQKARDMTFEAAQTARAIMTSLDFSAPLRQGLFMTLAHPIRTAKALGPMFRAALSKEGQARIEAEIRLRRNYPLALKSGLFLTEHGETTLTRMEEAYMSRWAEKIPLVAGSQRAYTTFLNRLRMDSFDAMVSKLSKGATPTPAEASAVANFVNVSTGRGGPKDASNAWAQLNHVFFAPRLVASRFQMIARPFMGFRQGGETSYRVRKMVAREYAQFLGGAALVYGLGAAAGAEIEWDPLSSDFGKMRWGNTRLDPMGGLLQNTVLDSRLVTGKKTGKDGKTESISEDVKFGRDDAWTVLSRFARTKFAPLISAAIDLRSGKNVVGEKVTLGSALAGLVTPMSLRDIYEEMVEDGGAKSVPLAVLSLFGMGLQTYDENKKRDDK